MIWACPSKPQAPEQGIRITTNEQWEAALLSSLPGLQAAVIKLAEDAARDHGFLTVV